MATIKAILNKQYKGKDNTYPIVVRVAHKNERRLFPIGYKVKEENWDSGEELVVGKVSDKQLINSTIESMKSSARSYALSCRLNGVLFSFEKVFKQQATDGNFSLYLEKRKEEAREKQMVSVYDRLKAILDQLKNWNGGDVYYSDLDEEALQSFEKHLIKEKNNANTRWSKFDILRIHYAKAIKKDGAPEPNPFQEYKIKKEPVEKVRYSMEEFVQFRDVKLGSKRLELYRDMWLFAYHVRGIRFENVITLKKSQITGGRLTYKAVKGGKIGSVTIRPELQKILDKYLPLPGEFIFPILKTIPKDKVEFVVLKNSKNVLVNRALERICKKAGLRRCTFHSSRHSLSLHLKHKGASIQEIRDILLHSETRMTERYLESFDDDTLDDTMDRVYK